MQFRLIAAVVFTLTLITTAHADAGCKKVAATDDLKISDLALQDLGELNLDRTSVFLAMINLSMPETAGCWSGATGSFDGQIVSAGVAQWNFGQNTLQGLLSKYRKKFASDEFKSRISELMPNYGMLLFSKGCLRRKDGIEKECREKLLDLQANGKLRPELKRELDNLFEDPVMIQVQVDEFVRMLTTVKSELQRIFPGQSLTSRKIKWAIDTHVQQGSFPSDQNIERIRKRLHALPLEETKQKLASLVSWYEGLARSVDQAGVRLDWEWNVENWMQVIEAGTVNEEQCELLHFSFIRSRVANQDSGLYQAVTFQRRAQTILGVGSVSGRRLDIRKVAQN